MPKDIQQGWITEAVAEALGIKGKYGVQLDDVVVPMVQTFDISRSPYGTFPVPGISVAGSPAVVGRFSYAGLRANDYLLEVLAVMVTASVQTRVDGGLVTPANFATDFTTTFTGFVTRASGQLDPTGAIQQLPHNLLVGSLVNFNWTQVFDASMAINTTTYIPLPQTVVLRPGGPIFFVRDTTANRALAGVTFHVRSWPLGG